MAIQPLGIPPVRPLDPEPMLGPMGGLLLGGAGSMGPGLAAASPQAAAVDASGRGFGAILAGLSGVEAGGQTALTDVAIGSDRDLHDTVLAVELESLAFDLAVQVRNRLVDAYQEIFRMSI